jgi:hypothetical protein
MLTRPRLTSMGRGRIVSMLEDLLRSPRALAFLAVLASDAWLPEAIAQLQKSETPPRVRDRSLLTDAVRLLRVFFATVYDWNWSPESRPTEPALLRLASVLHTVAEEVAGAPAAATWWDPLSRANQIWVHSPGAIPTKGLLRSDWASLHPWASKPRGGFWTSTALPPLPSTWLLVPSERRSEGQNSVWRLPVPATARIWEIGGPGAWAELCRNYPRDTTSIYAKEWSRWGVRQRRIVTPDWERVAADWDGVHLSIGGLLSSEGVPVTVDNAGSMLEGWGCEGTLWLRWAFEQPQQLADWSETQS